MTPASNAPLLEEPLLLAPLLPTELDARDDEGAREELEARLEPDPPEAMAEDPLPPDDEAEDASIPPSCGNTPQVSPPQRPSRH